MHESTDTKQAKRKKEAVWGVLVFTLLQTACAVCFGSLCLLPNISRWWFAMFFALAVLCLLLILPALWMLKVRWKEIKGGEIDAAGQY